MGIKIEKFCGTIDENFETWWLTLEIFLEREEIEEDDKTSTVIFYLGRKALEWYAELRRDGRLPDRMEDLKRIMSKDLMQIEQTFFP